ncbi:hypothetical protein FVF72_00745 [Methanothermobacter sp. KEPCO-1]|uniref:hypothetical protein n=1 Tax=Methanothermobacter sp. KEPCO-1 TaxID=2603820 RepID=UPI0011CA4011|nr:hypothetical protein [Methanothermobacter sp. KEPCO-1]QEF93810.1 hypothetical protein FVF72_00745 [Methanothermobacter sp. KEPCO-1]
MKAGYDGARYIDAFVENLWMWQVTNPELVSHLTGTCVQHLHERQLRPRPLGILQHIQPL